MNIKRLMLIVTYKCNLRCTHCFYWSPESASETQKELRRMKELSREEIENRVLRPFKMMDGTNVVITGGEPLVRKDIFEIIECARSIGLKVRLQTSLSIKVNQVIEVLRKDPEIRLQVSIDGNKKQHDQIRGEGNFDLIATNLSRIVESGYPTRHIQINCTVSDHNLTCLEELVTVLGELGVKKLSYQLITQENIETTENIQNVFVIDKQYQNDRAFQFARYLSNKCDISNFEFDQILDSADRALSRARAYRMRLLFYPLGRTYWDEHLLSWFNSNSRLPWHGCPTMYREVRVDPAGNIHPCMEVPMGNVRDVRLEAAFHGSKYNDFRKKIEMNEGVGHCHRCCALDGYQEKYDYREMNI